MPPSLAAACILTSRSRYMRTTPSHVSHMQRSVRAYSCQHVHWHVQDFAWNVSTYDGVTTDKVIRMRGVYSSSDIPSGMAVAFVPSSHLLHLSQFNRSKIWPSLEKMRAPPNTQNVRILQTSVGGFSCCLHARCTLQIIHFPSVAAFELSNPRSWWLPLLCATPPSFPCMPLPPNTLSCATCPRRMKAWRLCGGKKAYT